MCAERTNRWKERMEREGEVLVDEPAMPNASFSFFLIFVTIDPNTR
jgi:hypothetical protein